MTWLRLPRFRRRPAMAGAPAPLPEPRAAYAGHGWFRRHRKLCFAALIAACFVYGFFFAVLANVLLVQIVAPIMVPALLVIWVLPDTGRAPTRVLTFLLFAFVVGLLVWPDYIALDLPGLPWITIARLTGIPLIFILLISLSVSSRFRAEVKDVLDTEPIVWKLFAVFMVTAFVTIPFSPFIGITLNRLFTLHFFWAAMFLASCWVFRTPGKARLFAALIWPTTILICLFGLYEVQYQILPWAGRIPSFLTVQDETIQRVLRGSVRSATGVYRVQSKFFVSLTLGEYLAMATPFIIHATMTSRSLLLKLAGAALLPVIFVICIKTDSRLAQLGFLLSIVLYLLVWAALRWRDDPRSLFGPAITMSYPLIFLAFVAGTFVVPPLKKMVWGGGAQQASNDTRKLQWRMGRSRIAHNPIGTGVSSSGETLGFVSPSGIVTVDSYYLTILLEQGVVGFVSLFAALLIVVWRAGTTALRAIDPEIRLLMPISIALMNFIIGKSVLSQVENHNLPAILAGMALALIWRQKRIDRERITE